MRDPRTLLRLARGEMRKLATAGSAVLFVVFVSVLWQDAGRFSGLAEAQAPIAVAVTNDNTRAVETACTPGATDVDDACRTARLDLSDNRHFEPNSVALGRRAMALHTLPGLITFVSHQLATGLGWLLIALVAAGHVTRERSAGTLGSSVLRSGASRYLIGKVISLFGGAWAALCGATLVLFALRPTFTSSVEVPAGDGGVADLGRTAMRTLAPDHEWSSWASAGRGVLAAMVVVLAVCVLFGLVAAVIRQPATTAAVLGGFVVLLFAIAEWGHRSSWVPMRAISVLIGLGDPPYGLTDVRLWDTSLQPARIYDRAPTPPVPVASSLAWALACLVACALAVRVFRRRPIL